MAADSRFLLVARRSFGFALVCLLLLLFTFAPIFAIVFDALRALFFDRFFRGEVPDAPIRKSSRFAPALIFSRIHRGSAPRPAQTFDGLSGSRYFGGTLPPLRPPPVFAANELRASNPNR